MQIKLTFNQVDAVDDNENPGKSLGGLKKSGLAGTSSAAQLGLGGKNLKLLKAGTQKLDGMKMKIKKLGGDEEEGGVENDLN